MSAQNYKLIEQQHCTFYIHSTTNEWFLFSGIPTTVKTLSAEFVLDERTGFFTTTFETAIPERYHVYCHIAADLRGYEPSLLQLQAEKLFFQQLYTKQQEQQLALAEIMIALNSDLKIEPLLQKIMDYSLEAIPAIDRGFVMLFDDKQQRLFTVAKKGTTDAIYNYVPASGEGIAGYTFETGKSGIYDINGALKFMWNITTSNATALEDALSNIPTKNLMTMAVPIFSDTRKFGIMIVHQYSNKMPFQHRDLQLLESFASQAAVALKNAEAYERIEQLNVDYEQNNAIHQLFLNLTLQNVDEAHILAQTTSLLQHDIHYVNLLDRSTFPDDAVLTQLNIITERGSYLLTTPTYVYPVQNEQQIFGYLLYTTVQPIEAHAQRIIENAGLSLALKALQFQAKSQTNFKERFELFQYILAGQASSLDPRFEELQLQNEKATFCMTMKISQFTNWHVAQLIEHLTHYYPSHPFIFTQASQVVWIVQGDASLRETLIQQLPTILQGWVQFHQQLITIGVGTIQHTLFQIESSFSESEHALRHPPKSTIGVSIMRYEEIGINRLFGKEANDDIQHFIAQVLAPLTAQKDTVLLETLQCYIEHNRSISKAAEHLHIHQNTLYHRLQRIEQLTKRSLNDPDQLLELTLALHLYRTYPL